MAQSHEPKFANLARFRDVPQNYYNKLIKAIVEDEIAVTTETGWENNRSCGFKRKARKRKSEEARCLKCERESRDFA